MIIVMMWVKRSVKIQQSPQGTDFLPPHPPKRHDLGAMHTTSEGGVTMELGTTLLCP